MQTRRRRCGRAYLVRIYSLITFFIFKLFSDVRRQRHLTYLVENAVNVALQNSEFCNAVAVFQNVCYFSCELALAEYELRAYCLPVFTASVLIREAL